VADNRLPLPDPFRPDPPAKPFRIAYLVAVLAVALLFFHELPLHGLDVHDTETFADNVAISGDFWHFFSADKQLASGRPLAELFKWLAYLVGGNDPAFFHLLPALLHTAVCLLVLPVGLAVGLSPPVAAGTGLLFLVNTAHYQTLHHISALDYPLALLLSLSGLAALPRLAAAPSWPATLALALGLSAATAAHPACIFLLPVCIWWLLPGTYLKNRVAPKGERQEQEVKKQGQARRLSTPYPLRNGESGRRRSKPARRRRHAHWGFQTNPSTEAKTTRPKTTEPNIQATMRPLLPHLALVAAAVAASAMVSVCTTEESASGTQALAMGPGSVERLGDAVEMLSFFLGRLASTAHTLALNPFERPAWETFLGGGLAVLLFYLVGHWRHPASWGGIWVLVSLLPFAVLEAKPVLDNPAENSRYLYFASLGSSALLASALVAAGRLVRLRWRLAALVLAAATLLLCSHHTWQQTRAISLYFSGRHYLADGELEEASAQMKMAQTLGQSILPDIFRHDFDRALQLGHIEREMIQSLEAKDYPRLAQHWRDILTATPDHPKALFNLGLLLSYYLEEPEEAFTCWRRYVEVAPQDLRGHKHLAEAYRRRGDEQAARHHAEIYFRMKEEGNL
jgi:tetratricopeptide (TPR) repeat protein